MHHEPRCLRMGQMLLAEMTWSEVAALPRETPVVFPIAALEQHGRHMPLFIIAWDGKGWEG